MAGKKQEPLEFFDLVKRQKFTTTNYKVVEKRTKTGRIILMAETTSPLSGKKAVRILGPKK